MMDKFDLVIEIMLTMFCHGKQNEPADADTAVMDIDQASDGNIDDSGPKPGQSSGDTQSKRPSSSTVQSKRKQRRNEKRKEKRKQRQEDCIQEREADAALTMESEPSAHNELPREVNDQNLPANAYVSHQINNHSLLPVLHHSARSCLSNAYYFQDFITTSFDDPVIALQDSIHRLATQNGITFEEQVRQWAQQTDAMVAMATSTGNEKTHIPSNSAALEELYKQHVPTFSDPDPYELMEEEVDDGHMMPQELGSSLVQSMQISTHLFIDGNLHGNPDKRALQNVSLPDKSTEDSVIFRTTYVNPEYSYSYVYVKLYRWAPDWNVWDKKFLKQLGTIRIPLKLAQRQEPTIEYLDEAAAAKFLGVDKCPTKVVKYTLTCTAHCDLDFYPVQRAPESMRDEILTIASLLNGQDMHEISIIHRIHEESDDLEQDYAVEWVRGSIDAWHRDGGDPQSIYFEKSPYKRIMTAGTVPKGNEIPYLPQLPPVSRFVDKSQYLVTFAVGKQQEKEYHERLHQQLEQTILPIKARLIPDLPTRHPVSGKPKQYLMLVDPAHIPEIAHLLPRTGDQCKITFPGVQMKDQSNPDVPAQPIEVLIAEYIRDIIQTETKSGNHSDRETMYRALEEPLKSLCLKGSDAEIDRNIRYMNDSIPKLDALTDNADNHALIEWIKGQMDWLQLPAGELGDVDGITQPLQCSAVRVAVTSKLWTSTTQLYKLTVPADPKTGEARLPYALDIPDPTVDDQGRPVTSMGSFIEKFTHEDSYLPIRFEFVDSNKTHKLEANALQKLSAPHTMPLHDRPSSDSVDLFHDLITMEPRPIEPLRERLPVLAQLAAGKHQNPHLQKMYHRLSKDKHQGIQMLLDDTRALHIINGPPGTGKTELLMHIAGFAIATMVPPHLVGRDEPADLGPRISLEDFDKLGTAEIERPGSTSKGKGKEGAKETAEAISRHHRVLFVTNNNQTTDDMVSRAQKTFRELNLSHKSILNREPVIIRTYCVKNELKDFPRKFTKIFQGIERLGTDGVGGVVWSLITGVSESVHAYSRKGRKMKGTSVSLAEVAATLFEKDKTEAQKYKNLRAAIDEVKDNPDCWSESAKFILREAEMGPFADAIGMADFIATTHVPAADIRKYFRADIVIEDEQPRVMESTSLILIAHFSPLARFGVGDTRQCGPLVFSTHQHRRYRPPPAFKQADAQNTQETLAQQVTSGQTAVGGGWAKPELPASGEETIGDWDKTKPLDSGEASQSVPEVVSENPQSGEASQAVPEVGSEDPEVVSENPEVVLENPEVVSENPEVVSENPDSGENGDDDEDLPIPATFAQQLKWSLPHRWVASGNPVVQLTENFRSKGLMSDFFNRQYYNGRLLVRLRKSGTFDKDYKTTMKFLRKLTHDDKLPINSVMVNLNSREGVSGRSATNMTNANFVMAQVHNLLADDDFTGKIMIIAPYQGQMEIYEWELSQRCSIEYDSSNKRFTFDRSRIHLCTHQGAQGVEAEVVFIDMVRSDKPGMTGEPELINVATSRAICAQVVIQNTFMFEKLQSRNLLNAPNVRDLSRLHMWHVEEGTLVDLPGIDYRVMCNMCYKTGHKKKECPMKTDGHFICPVSGCMGSHHPRNCRILRSRRLGDEAARRADEVAAKAHENADEQADGDADGAGDDANANTTVPRGPSEKAKKLGASNRTFRNKLRELREANAPGTGTETTAIEAPATEADTTGWGTAVAPASTWQQQGGSGEGADDHWDSIAAQANKEGGDFW